MHKLVDKRSGQPHDSWQSQLRHARLGGDQETFLANWETDALAVDPIGSFDSSWRECLRVFGQAGALDRLVDYPMGEVPGRQALAIRTVDTLIHTWDLARAIGEDANLDAQLVEWALTHLDDIYGDLAEMPKIQRRLTSSSLHR